MTDPRTENLLAHSCPGKATTSGDLSEHIVTKVVDCIDFPGRDQIVLKTDNENLLAALQARVQKLRSKPVVPINGSRGGSQSNGAVENAVQRL